MFEIAASYWSDKIFVGDGQGGWKFPRLNTTLDQRQLEDRIKKVFTTRLSVNGDFQGFCTLLFQAATANTRSGLEPLSPALWPRDAHQLIDHESCTDFSKYLRAETVEAAESNSTPSGMLSGTADAFSADQSTFGATKEISRSSARAFFLDFLDD